MVASEKITYDYDEDALAIDKMLLRKKRFLTKGFLREIIVLNSIYSQEKAFKKGLENVKKEGRDVDSAIETYGLTEIIDYAPKAINDLLMELQENSKSDFINVTPDWIKKVLILYEEVLKNYRLCLIADKFSG